MSTASFPGYDPHRLRDRGIGQVQLHGVPTMLRMSFQRWRERCHRRDALFPLSHPDDERVCVVATPYIFRPERSPAAAMQPHAYVSSESYVESSGWVDLQRVDIGQAQGWCYPASRTIVLWECYIHDWCQSGLPIDDPILATLWTQLEHTLREQLPTARRIVTPAWEILYEQADWHEFLAARGFQPLTKRAHVKTIG